MLRVVQDFVQYLHERLPAFDAPDPLLVRGELTVSRSREFSVQELHKVQVYLFERYAEADADRV